jgi:probable rRNA maturation factor
MSRNKILIKVKEINFINFPKKFNDILKKTVLLTLKLEKVKNYSINFIMVSDNEIKKINAKYRKVRRITDVISFLVEPDNFFGDIYISKNCSKMYAKEFGNSWEQELAYLAIHGVLHLCGYTDYDSKNKTKMFAKQDEIFECLF